MTDAAETLTEREKETLRLLLVGHDAKSIARNLVYPFIPSMTGCTKPDVNWVCRAAGGRRAAEQGGMRHPQIADVRWIGGFDRNGRYRRASVTGPLA